MTVKLNDGDLNCFVVDNDTVVLKIKDNQYVLDYSLLIDSVIDLAQMAKTVESMDPTVQPSKNIQ